MESIPLLKLMSADIAQQREHIRAAARREADEVEANARKTGEKRHDNAIAIVDYELNAMAERSRGRVEAESHMVIMTTKDTVTEELLAAIEKELAEIAAGSGFPGILESLLAELMQEGPEEGVVLAPPQHLDRCRDWLAKNGHTLEVQADPHLKDGVAVQDKSGSFRITNTLSARFEKRKSELRKSSVEQLFDKEVKA